jgi:hypothetical protein
MYINQFELLYLNKKECIYIQHINSRSCVTEAYIS